MGTSTTFRIDVGPLNGLGSLVNYLGDPLTQVSAEYSKGKIPQVEWDFTHVEPRHISMASLTAFVAVSYRLREFTGQPQMAICRWDPQVFAFWDDISLLSIVEKYNLITWPPGMFGGYSRKTTNPNTKILLFEFEEPPDQANLDTWKDWKDTQREAILDRVMYHCGSVFESDRRIILSDTDRMHLALTMSELTLNSILHGRSAALVGIQKSTKGITVAVCDCGVGFSRTIGKKLNRFVNDVESMVIASQLNAHEWGLRRAIEGILKSEGWIIMSTFAADIRWRPMLWNKVKDWGNSVDFMLPHFTMPSVRELLGEQITGPVGAEYANGFYRVWNKGLRGSRISFEIPFTKRVRRII